MTGRVGRPPRANPFASRCVEPGAVSFVFPDGRSAADLARRFAAADRRGQIVGPHGSGKSTLLAALLPLLPGWPIRHVRLSESDRVLPDDVWDDVTRLLVIDGFEQLGYRIRRRLRTTYRTRGGGLLVTAHRPMGLPTLYRTDLTAEVAARVVDRVVPAAGRGVLDGYDLPARLRRHRGSLREVFFELYDRWETGPGFTPDAGGGRAMTRDPIPAPDATDNPVTAGLPDPGTGVPAGNDPGGAHGKGYGADADPHAPPLPDPIPLADAPEGGIHVPR